MPYRAPEGLGRARQGSDGLGKAWACVQTRGGRPRGPRNQSAQRGPWGAHPGTHQRSPCGGSRRRTSLKHNGLIPERLRTSGALMTHHSGLTTNCDQLNPPPHRKRAPTHPQQVKWGRSRKPLSQHITRSLNLKPDGLALHVFSTSSMPRHATPYHASTCPAMPRRAPPCPGGRAWRGLARLGWARQGMPQNALAIATAALR